MESSKTERLPDEQYIINRLPVISMGEIPNVSREHYVLSVFWDITERFELDWGMITSMPRHRLTADMHCVTRWSSTSIEWEGTRFSDLCRRLPVPRKETKYVIFHSHDGYTTNLPLKIVNQPDVILAYKMNNKLIPKGHGAPLRVVVPSRYGYKSAKWLKAIEFTNEERRGTKECMGYHNEGDPWKNQRFSWQEE